MQTEQVNPFVTAFSAWQSERHDLSWAARLRQEAFSNFSAVGLPTRKHENWKYTSLRQVTETNFRLPEKSYDRELVSQAIASYLAPDRAALSTGNDIRLIFVNGQLDQQLSNLSKLPIGLSITTLGEALQQENSAVRQHLERKAPLDQPLTQLNAAFLGHGLVLHLAARSAIKRPVHLIHVTTPEARDALVAYRHLISLDEASEMTLTETHLSIGESKRSFSNSLTEIYLSRGAQLEHARLQIQGGASLNIARCFAELARDSKYNSFSLALGSSLSRFDLDINLAGEGSEAELNGLYLTKTGHLVDHHTAVHHLVPNATSRQLYKGILDGESRAVFNGKVCVARNAQGTKALQMNRNLLLSEQAEIDTKPELQIDADDVKCSHGASIGQLDDAQLFYLQSRGLSSSESRQLLTQAFADEAVLKAPYLIPWLRPLTMDYFR